jgi:hypothetical protein
MDGVTLQRRASPGQSDEESIRKHDELEGGEALVAAMA